MKKSLTIIVLVLIASLASAQNGVTFTVDENLTPIDEDNLDMEDYQSRGSWALNGIFHDEGILEPIWIAQSFSDDERFYTFKGKDVFFQTIVRAYAEHRPLVLSIASCTNINGDNPVQPQQRERIIAFEGIENGRDMGSLVMQDGRTVRFDMLVRSGHLAAATDADVAILKNQYHLSDVFDFRFDAEKAAAPDRVIDGVTYTHLSTLPEALIAAMASGSSSSEQVDTRDIGSLVINKAFDPQAQEFARQLYPAIVTDGQAQQYYGEFLRGVLNAKGGVLWHCSQGKDRAGWASAFVLAALGASRETIVEDFDLSNQSYAA